MKNKNEIEYARPHSSFLTRHQTAYKVHATHKMIFIFVLVFSFIFGRSERDMAFTQNK